MSLLRVMCKILLIMALLTLLVKPTIATSSLFEKLNQVFFKLVGQRLDIQPNLYPLVNNSTLIKKHLQNITHYINSSLNENAGQKLYSTVTRFSNISINPLTNALPAQGITRTPLVLISITSGPHHAHLRRSIRDTWVLPCAASPRCTYRFFVDVAPDMMTKALLQEQRIYGDLVFREACPYMLQRHPNFINYGNCQISGWGHVNVTLEERDYHVRRMYKIDWKVCFLRWALESGLRPEYHVFVEDDSFVCTENLLHQLSVLSLRSRQRGKTVPLFRAGTRMYDGFDDSSTIMSGAIGEAFARHYLRDRMELNCSKVIDSDDPNVLEHSIWMSWGNSWMSKLCNWRNVLKTMPQTSPLPPLGHINEPLMDCLSAYRFAVDADQRVHVYPAGGGSGEPRAPLKDVTFTPNNVTLMPVRFPCQPHRPLVMHDSLAHEHLQSTFGPLRMRHMCEYMLLVDKVKKPADMFDLWNTATAVDFADLSAVFLEDEGLGWLHVLERVEQQEAAACKATKSKGGRAGDLGERPENEDSLYPDICIRHLDASDGIQMHEEPGESVVPTLAPGNTRNSGGTRKPNDRPIGNTSSDIHRNNTTEFDLLLRERSSLRRLRRLIHRRLYPAGAGSEAPSRSLSPPPDVPEDVSTRTFSLFRLYYGSARNTHADSRFA